MINTQDKNKAKQLIKNSKSKDLSVLSQNHDFNRSVLEYGKFSTLEFPNLSIKTQRRLKYIDSSLDYVSAKAAAKNKITILYDLSKIIDLPKKAKAIELEKLAKIIALCRKHNVSFRLSGFKEKLSALALLHSLSASSQQAKKAVELD